jgi:hypothetical protein
MACICATCCVTVSVAVVAAVTRPSSLLVSTQNLWRCLDGVFKWDTHGQRRRRSSNGNLGFVAVLVVAALVAALGSSTSTAALIPMRLRRNRKQEGVIERGRECRQSPIISLL